VSDKTDFKTNLYISGQWSAASEGATIPVYDPSNGEVIACVADATFEDAAAAIDAASAAASNWAKTPARQRGEILRRAYELMTRDAERLAYLISLENGKALRDARGEVTYAAEFFRWFAEEAVRNNGDLSISPSGANRILVQYQPIGVSLLVTPWNFPAAMATRKIAPALAAGCTCILKPATETPLTAYAIAEILEEAGVPGGVVNVITTSKTSRIIDRMLDDSRIRKLSFTGSTEIGRVLLRKAADRIVNCSMELGGNAPFIVFDDANLEHAVEGAMVAKMRNGGEACTAANRFYVQKSIADKFIDSLTNRMTHLKVGPGVNQDTECGPLINAASVRKVASLVEDAIAHGAQVHCGGGQPEHAGYFYQPTVLSGAAPEALISVEEIFGPVASITTFETEDEAIGLANNTEYGLVSYVYTDDLARGLRVAERLEAGMIAINRGLVSDPAAPFGGVKQSGLGREGAHHGMLEFMEAQYIATNW
jgi:succinate-semialdehyde dehydrogenase/glutarate-semialdehyde dehydrogenase